MRILTARVKDDGQIETPPGALAAGQTVTIVVHGEEEFFELSKEEEAALQDSIEQIERGEYVDGWELLRELETRHS